MAQRRLVTRQNMIGNTRMDAALDAMGQFGFKRKLVRETVDELLDVYEGNQGWPFIEEASYKLLIEAILAKQQSSVEKKDNTTRITGINEIASSNLVTQSSVLHARDDLDSASQTSDHHGPPPLGNLGTDIKAKPIIGNVQGSYHETYGNTVKKTVVRSSGIESSKAPDKLMNNVKGNNHRTSVSSVENTTLRSSMIESANRHDKLMNKEKGSNHRTFVNKVENTIAGNSMIESSKTRDELPHRPCYGWIGSDNNVDLIYFPVPEHIKKLIAQSDGSQIPRGKSRWDEKADDM